MAISKKEKNRRTRQSYKTYLKQWNEWQDKGYPMESDKPYTLKEYRLQHELSRRSGVKNIARELAASQRTLVYSELKQVTSDVKSTLKKYEAGELETTVELKEILTKKGVKKEKKEKKRTTNPQPIELTDYQKTRKEQLLKILEMDKKSQLNIIGKYTKEVKGTMYYGREAFYLDLKYTYSEEFADEVYGYGSGKDKKNSKKVQAGSRKKKKTTRAVS